MRIYTARNRGFGPVSKAVSILKVIDKTKGTESIFLGKGSTLGFAKKANCFDRVIDQNQLSTFEYNHLLKKCDFCISVMEQDIAIDCFINNVPYYFFDSLFEFWKVSNEDSFLSKLKNITHNDIKKIFTSHEMKILSHFLAERSFIQASIAGNERFMRLRKNFPNSILISPIIDINPCNDNIDINPNILLFNLGGFTQNLGRLDLYYKFIKKIASSLLEDSSLDINEVVITSGNEDKWAEEISSNHKSISHKFLSHDKFICQILNAKYFVTAPGLTTILEAISLRKTPVIAFEQHQSHIHNLQVLKASNLSEKCISINDYFETANENIEYSYGSALKHEDIFQKIYSDIKSKLLNNSTQYIDTLNTSEYFDFHKLNILL